MKVLTILLAAVCLLTVPVFAQSPVKGRVTDGQGKPVPRASVVVKGAQTGVSTDDNGEFTITAPGNGTLVISSVGFPSKEVIINGQTQLNISLQANASDLDQVIVVGYGTQRKRDVTGSTVSVKGETLNEIKAPNIFNQLQGRAAGVDIVSNSTQIGAGGEIRIRGNRSITGNNNPLIVVDGMVYGGSVNDINPDNIANVDILKDASATAIYGSRGSNGVIIISTKRGTSGKATTTYNGYAGMSKALDTWRVFNAEEYAQFKEDARQGQPAYLTNPNVISPYGLTPIETSNLAEGVNTDWQDLLLTTGMRTGHDISIRGGNERTQYFFGLGYYRETGIVHDQSLDRPSFSVNIDHKMSNKLKIGFTSFNTMFYSNRVGTNAFGTATRIGPIYKPYNEDGTLNLQPTVQQGVDNNTFNPLTSIGNNDLIKARSRRYQFQHNVYGEWQILKELKFRSTFGFSWSQTFNSNYNGPGTIFNTNLNTAGSNLSQSNA